MGDSQDEHASMIGMKEIKVLNSQTYRKVVQERRFMAAAMVLTAACAVLFFVAVATTGWLVVKLEYVDGSVKTCYIGIWGEYVVSSRVDDAGAVNQSHSLHLQEFVADVVRGTSHSGDEVFIHHFPYPPKEIIRLIRNIDLPHFYRTQAVFSVFALVLMVSSVGCAFYSLSLGHRYIYKRLTAGLQAISAMCVLIVIEVMIYSVKEWHLVLTTNSKHTNKFANKDDYLNQKTNYSYSTVIAWFVFAIYVVAAVIFIFGSRKRKGSQAATEDFEVADRPMVIGR